MSRVVRAALVQASANLPKQQALDKHAAMIQTAASRGAQIVCLQEIFFVPYFPVEKDPKWFEQAESDDGPSVTAMRELARQHSLVLIVPIFERASGGVFYNTAVLIDADGSVLGKYRKCHIPNIPGTGEERYYFTPGNLGYPIFESSVGRVGVLICYDRHFPEAGRVLGLAGAEIVFTPSATVESISRHLWEVEQPALAAANGFFVGAVNRVGEELVAGSHFYGSSYFCDPRGQILAQASDQDDEVLVADLDLDLVAEARTMWRFFRYRRPDTYGDIVEPIPTERSGVPAAAR